MMSNSARAPFLLCSSAISLLALSMPAFAQDQRSVSVDEVVITATRSETDLQRTPIAVTALNDEALEQRGVTNLLDLGALAPNVTVNSRSGTGTGSGSITIRGIGLDANAPASPAVGIYVDEVYTPAAFGNLIGLFDVERIEVLRGPQGTLFGRNTIGGALQYVTRRPEIGDFSGHLEGTTGELNRADISGAVNLPLGDQAALRISASSLDRDGYVRDSLNGVDRGSQSSEQGRVQLRVEPTDALTIDLKFEALDQHGNGRATIPVGFGYATVFGGPFAPSGLDPFIATDSRTFAGFNGRDEFASSLRLGQAVVSYDLSESVRFRAISAYSETEARIDVDQDNTPLNIIHVSRGAQTDRLFTQEFQLTGDSFADRLHWTLGVYYYDGSLDSVGAVASIFGGPPSDPFGDYTIDTVSTALYGQLTYDLTDRLSVVAGLRRTTEDIDIAGGLGPVVFPSTPYSDSAEYEDTSPLLGLNFQVTDEVMLYVKGSRGFRAGSFAPVSFQAYAFEPETATTYEAGVRSEVFSRRLRLNATVFQTEWKDIQFNSVVFQPGFPFPLPIIQNGGDAEARGAELESQWAVTENFTLNFNAAWFDGEYTRIDPALLLQGKLTLDSELGRSPESQYALSGVYELPLGSAGELDFSASYAWQADQRSSTADTDFVTIDAYGLLSGRVQYTSPDERWSLAVFGTNVTDEDYLVGGTNYPRGGSIPTITNDIGRPREWGASLRVNF